MTPTRQPGINNNHRKMIDTLCWLIEQAFAGEPAQSLISNPANLREQDWLELPPGAGRSIGEIVEHVGWSKWMIEKNYLTMTLESSI